LHKHDQTTALWTPRLSPSSIHQIYIIARGR
jgi:hypothetical protein